MPNLDRTGPRGQGPMTGRGRGQQTNNRTRLNSQILNLLASGQQQQNDNFLSGLGQALSYAGTGLQNPAALSRALSRKRQAKEQRKFNKLKLMSQLQPDMLEQQRRRKNRIWKKYLDGGPLTKAEKQMIGVAPTTYKVSSADVSAQEPSVIGRGIGLLENLVPGAQGTEKQIQKYENLKEKHMEQFGNDLKSKAKQWLKAKGAPITEKNIQATIQRHKKKGLW